MAGLQAASKFPGAPATILDLLPPQKKTPKIQIPGIRFFREKRHTPLHTFTDSHRGKHTQASEYLLTRTLESSRGRQFGFLWAAALQPPPRRNIQQGTPGLLEREAESCPKAPGNAAGTGGGTREQKRIRLQPKAGSGRVNPGSKGAAPLYLQTIHLAGGRGSRSRAERPEQQPPGHPTPGRSCVWVPLQARGTHTPLIAPIPTPCPVRGRNSPGSPRREGGAAHLIFRKSIDWLSEPGRHGAGAQRGSEALPGGWAAMRGAGSALLLRGRPAQHPASRVPRRR